MEHKVVVTEEPSTSISLNPPSRIVCHVCQKQFSQYTCPRCNSRYCSLQCYKSHSLRCTESFMRENVVEELRHMHPDDETKRKMLDILKRFHSHEETDSMNEDESILSEEIIQKVLSGGQVNFDDLSHEEKKRFQRAIASGKLSKMIEPWDPWWLKSSARTISLSKEGTQLVQQLPEPEEFVSTKNYDGGDGVCEIPAGPETSLPPISRLSPKEPSPLLSVHLVDIIYSYCFTLRLYNGDWKSDSIGSAMVVLSVSSVLGHGKQPETVREALSHSLEQICSPAYRHMGGLEFAFGLIDDVICLLSLGTPALVCLLCDMQRLIKAGEREIKLERPKKMVRDEIRSKLKLAAKKIYFVMCWVHEQPGEAWSSLEAIVRAEKVSAMELRGSEKADIKNKRADSKGKILIQEMMSE